jgi:hypothetical protein
LLSLLVASWCSPSSSEAGTPQGESRTAHAVRVDRAPKVDGTLSDPLWQSAEPITNFLQREPYEGQPPTEKTEVRILYTRRAAYFGIVCHDSDPKRIVATELRRDASQDLDDYFEIVIDATHNHRNAYVFQINPLGTQHDGLINEGDRSGDSEFDSGWDGVWISEAHITADGWTATIEIPFSTLNFIQSDDVIWGLNFKRFIRQKNEEDLWSAWKRTSGISKISQAGELSGLREINSGRLLIVKPYALGGFRHVPAGAASAAGLQPGMSRLLTGGLDIKIGLRSNLVANLTANTDFADADVDIQQFNLTPFKLFFPEKRQFFLENAGIFDFPMQSGDLLFFSRQIGVDNLTGQQVPINGGGKVTGTLAGFDVGIMDVNTRSNGPNPYANYAVVRIKHSLPGGSYIGAMGIDKRSGKTALPYNQTGGVDTRLVFYKNLIVTGFVAESRTPGVSSGQTDLGAEVRYRTNWLDAGYAHKKIGPNFNPEVGFIERTDSNSDFGDVTFRVRPKFSGIREMNFEGFLFHSPDTHGVLQTQEWQTTFRAEFHNGAYTDDDIVDVFTQRLTEPFNIYKNIFIPVGMYHWARHQFTYGSPQDRKFIIRLFERFGTYYGGHLNEARIRVSYRPNARMSFALGPQWNRFRLPQGNFSVVVGSFEANYAFSRFLSLSTLVQLDTANTHAASANIRLRWNYRPDSDLYVIYTAGPRFANLAAASPQQFDEHRFAIKYTYSFSP